MTDLSFPSAMSELVRRFRENPDYMAYVLARYQEQEGLSDENLAEALGTLPHLAIRLALCRKPDAGATDFAARVREIADYTLMDESVLANIIRQVSSLQGASNRVGAADPFCCARPQWCGIGDGIFARRDQTGGEKLKRG